MKISIITVCHKSIKAIHKYVNSFLLHHSPNQEEIKYEFVFVENSGQPEIRKAVKPLSEAGCDVIVVNSDNYGFGAGCNLGVKNSSGDLLVFANPDIKFLTNLSHLTVFATNGVWGTVRQLSSDKRICSIDLLPEYKTLAYEVLRIYRYIHKYPKHFLDKCYAVGSFLIVERKLFDKSGGFNPAFFLYYEEAELCRRLQKIGGPPVIEHKVSIIHEGFGSHESHEHALRYEAEGLITYCEITSNLSYLRRRLRQLWIFGLISDRSRKRYLLLKSLCFSKAG